jgi:hypothetical protein
MPVPVDMTTKAGRLRVTAPSPYSTHEPRLGRPGWAKPVFKKDLRRRVVELVGMHRLDEADVIDHPRQVRQHFRQFRPTLAVLGEGEARPEDGGVGPDESVALAADDRRRQRLAFEFLQLRLVIEEVELAGGACHEYVNDAFGLGCEMRLARR